ncbi:hypothetical protein GCM10010924_59540 [Rhizobium wenxiniae]|uniref:Uncharacterized protein n=1 Tax=Rhizobium wenxiniae TaxID=1737357 RepID=A0A7X0D342_9HYPH|nr:hypothetical protein [Rhizobium wenxiniae]GGG22133.1 hypothetical protein GCM10010924_59540 [Rhizobium wenxiniae]
MPCLGPSSPYLTILNPEIEQPMPSASDASPFRFLGHNGEAAGIIDDYHELRIPKVQRSRS